MIESWSLGLFRNRSSEKQEGLFACSVPSAFPLPEGIGWADHLHAVRFQRQLLIRRAARIVVEALDMTVFTAEGDVVEPGDGEALSRVGGSDEASF